MQKALFGLGLMALLASCQPTETTEDAANMTYVPDTHSFANPQEAVVTHLDWEATVDFDSKTIQGVARLTIKRAQEAQELVLDTKDLTIEKVTLGAKEAESDTEFSLGVKDLHKGQALTIALAPEGTQVNVYYTTSPGAEAVQWLDPVQTGGKVHPFLFTQSQAILARSWVPIQDSPGIRFTYSAQVTVPTDLRAVMSAGNPTEKNEEGVYSFEMKQPIPAYLLALSVGDIEFQSLGARSGVYAEPGTLESAVYEFADLEKMIDVAEGLYGPYRWDRYDILVLPPSFPFGGMENPRLTFATPTILAGDRSLVSLVAHELAHSWSGNLVTNATWDDFWLNEGFTVYFEQRIMEAMEGRDYSEMLASLSQQDLKAEVAEMLQSHPEDSHLKLDLEGRSPDEGLTTIAYDKGYFFLRWLEGEAGRENFDVFIKNYFEANAFQTMSTVNFLSYMEENLVKANGLNLTAEDWNAWVYGPGLPPTLPEVTSDRFDQVDQALSTWMEGGGIVTENWSSHEWLRFVRQLPEHLTHEQMAKLDAEFGFTKTGNSEVLTAWLEQSVNKNYEEAYARLRELLVNTGRRKFLVPLYKALLESDKAEMANSIYREARPNYHFVSTNTLDAMLDWDSAD
ncbi:MAG TPA: aminopeptidase [Cytophagales bacterium]|nr:aminopeptidase [Cytophagales bacterium]